MQFVNNQKLNEAKEKGVDEYIKVFIDYYLSLTGEELSTDTMDKLNGYQHVLLSYYYFQREIMEGGFIQLIQNGYGSYIFDNPFAKAMRLFGAKEFSRLIYKAKEIYDAHKEDLTKECTEEEFMAMYEQYEVFDDLEEAFMEMEEEITHLIAEYVEQNIQQFAPSER